MDHEVLPTRILPEVLAIKDPAERYLLIRWYDRLAGSISDGTIVLPGVEVVKVGRIWVWHRFVPVKSVEKAEEKKEADVVRLKPRRGRKRIMEEALSA